MESAPLSEAQRLDLRILAATPTPWDVLPQEVLFIHLFSGRRRDDDLQAALERCVLSGGRVLKVLRVDVQIDEKLCNLADPEAQALWINLVGQKIAGSAAGPPCESWSAARWVRSRRLRKMMISLCLVLSDHVRSPGAGNQCTGAWTSAYGQQLASLTIGWSLLQGLYAGFSVAEIHRTPVPATGCKFAGHLGCP